MSAGSEKDYKGKLIAAVKKEVKQVMEESVTRKFVHEESGSVTSLCGAVEACLSQGLRRRALGLFKTSSTTALLHKIAKHNEEAAAVSRRVQELENSDPNRRSSSSSDSLTKPATLRKNASLPSPGAAAPKYLWIRLALFEKRLARIIDYLVTNAGKYYDKDALVADADYGTILGSLLVGPCALDYSRTKTPDHFWTDPPADELVQRHRISSGHSTPPSARRPIINFRRSLNTSADDPASGRGSSTHYAKDYVESLHQNSRATLLFGKNNVRVLPVNADATEPMPGYLSLHQTAHCLTIKWTPNQLMNGFADEAQDKSTFWDYALQVRLDEIVYVHCHQDAETGGTVILVGQDGVQRPPIHFPKGGHMLAFLSCIETGLLPMGRLDPPLWSQRCVGGVTAASRKKKRPLPALSETEEATRDYVFRIVDNASHKDILKRKELLDTRAQLPCKVRVQLASSSTSSDSSSKSFSLDQQNGPESPPSVCIRAVCDSMKRQIISRAFYGWLAYCRHLSTVRTHLSGLVNAEIVAGDNAEDGLTPERWLGLCVGGVLKDSTEVYRLTYYGGIDEGLRREVWPYLLGHHKFGSTSEERARLDEETKQAYENTMSEWLAVEAIVKQRDKETQASAIAKLSSESMSGDQVPQQMARDLSNDVFEDVSDYEDVSHEEDAPKGLKTKQNTIRYESDEEETAVKQEGQQTSQEADEVIVVVVPPEEGAEGSAQENVLPEGVNDEAVADYSSKDVTKSSHENAAVKLPDEDAVVPTQANERADETESHYEDAITVESPYEDAVDTKLPYEDVVDVKLPEDLACAEGPYDDAAVETPYEDAVDTKLPYEDVREESPCDAAGSPHEDTLVTKLPHEDVIGVKHAEGPCDAAGSPHEDPVVPGDVVREGAFKPPGVELSDEVVIVVRPLVEAVVVVGGGEVEGDFAHSVIVTNASVDLSNTLADLAAQRSGLDAVAEENNLDSCLEAHGLVSPAVSACASPASSNGGVYSTELLETFGLNLHRIEKDVQRCDRNYWYFAGENLDKLRNIMCTYVWEHLDVGYMQGMCDLVAPLLVIFNDESLTYACFCHLMERMVENFPNGTAMDCHFANMRSLIQILDSEMYELMHSHGDYTHFYFCYRWFLLDFKRELVYPDVYATWEAIWAAQHAASAHFVLFLALAFLETYREIILSNAMDFTDIIKFFNEMAERHDAAAILRLSRDLVLQLQLLIENK